MARQVTRSLGCLLLVAALAIPAGAAERVVDVVDDASLRKALSEAQPGWRIVLAPGAYRAGVAVRGLRGTAELPVVIQGADPKDPPVFEGGELGIHFSECAYVTLRNVVVRGQSGNGINVDDGGKLDTPSHHISLEQVFVGDIGPRGNRDAIKLSGVDDVGVIGCVVEGWGGQGIDMVGCHRARVVDCTFRGKAGFDQQIAVQAKGGSSDVTIRGCAFLNVGQRGVNLGGSTDPKVFRPRGATYEAKDVTVEGCRFVGGMAAVAFVGSDGGTVRYNTIYRPQRWVVRILQENTAEGMVPCRNGRFERNLVVYDGAAARAAVNVGGKTEPRGFVFRENWWFNAERADGSRPDLPAGEEGGVYGEDPGVTVGGDGVVGVPSAEGARRFGADALRE